MIKVLIVCFKDAGVFKGMTEETIEKGRRDFPECDICYYPVTREIPDDVRADLQKKINETEVLVGAAPKEMLKTAKNLKWHHLQTAGVNGYEKKKIYPDGVIVTRSGDVFSPAMAEHTLAMILGLNRNFTVLGRQAMGKTWKLTRSTRELTGTNVLLVGTGSIARAIVERLQGFGCTISAIRRDTSKKMDGVSKMYSDKLEALKDADYVINSLPLTDETLNYIGEAEFAAMKEGAIYVNIGRGTTTDTAAMIKALSSGHLGGAGLDVVDTEPLGAESPLWDMENVIITPHNSGVSPVTEIRRAACFFDNLRRYVDGKPLEFVVDFDKGY